MASKHGFPAVSEVLFLFKSAVGQYRQNHAVANFLFVGFLKVAGWPLCEQNDRLGL